jgi:hypothetical protein
MNIKVRQRKPKDGIIKLYLDIYNPKASKPRTTKTLDLILYDNPKGAQRKLNKEALEAAEMIRSKILLEYSLKSNDLEGLYENDKEIIDFIEYFRIQTDKRFESMNNYGNWDSVHKHLKHFCPNGVPIRKIDGKWLEDLKYYLQNVAKTKSNTNLSQNSLHSYFNKVKACLRIAHREGLISKNPADLVKGFKQGEVQREFLTFEELQAAANAECDIPQLKTAFLFSALTGIRWSDINQLIWNDLQYLKQGEHWLIRFRQKKTKGTETLPISNQARELLGKASDPNDRILRGSNTVLGII